MYSSLLSNTQAAPCIGYPPFVLPGASSLWYRGTSISNKDDVKIDEDASKLWQKAPLNRSFNDVLT